MASYTYGAHQFIWVEHWTDNCLPILDAARKLGLGCFEISLGNDIEFNPAPVRKRAIELGLELTVGPGNLWPMECDISSEKKISQQLGVDWHKRMIERTAEIGAVAYCGAIYGRPGQVLRLPPQVSEWDRIANNLHHLADYAGTLGVELVLEPMSRFRTHILNTAQQAVDLVAMTGHNNLMINLDTYHLITEERDYAKAIRTAGKRLRGIHACENDRGVPGGGLVPWNEVFSSLKDSCPQARILLETYHTGTDGFGYKRGIFKNVCPDSIAFVKEGLSFLKRCADSD